MLLGNYNVFNRNTGRAIGGITDPSRWMTSSVLMNFYTGEHYKSGETEKASFSNGYNPPYSWVLAPKSGGIASTSRISGSGSVTLNLAAGKNIVASLSGSGSLTAGLDLIISLAAALAGTGSISTASLNAPLQLAASLSGSGSISADLNALGNLVAALIGIGQIDADIYALANLEADITPFTTLSPENLAASVWNSIASDFNTSGTMGEKMNDAGAAGNPWSADPATNNNPDTMGELVQRTEKKVDDNQALIITTI